MLSYPVYKMIHLVGIFMTLIGLGALAIRQMSGTPWTAPGKTLAVQFHGIGLLLALFGGFGLLAKLGLAREIPGWAWIKVVIWVVLGGSIAIVKRKPNVSAGVTIVLMILATFAAYLALFKPAFIQ